MMFRYNVFRFRDFLLEPRVTKWRSESDVCVIRLMYKDFLMIQILIFYLLPVLMIQKFRFGTRKSEFLQRRHFQDWNNIMNCIKSSTYDSHFFFLLNMIEQPFQFPNCGQFLHQVLWLIFYSLFPKPCKILNNGAVPGTVNSKMKRCGKVKGIKFHGIRILVSQFSGRDL